MLDDLMTDDDTQSEPRRPERKRRWPKRLLAAFLTLALLIGVGLGGYLFFLNHIVTKNLKQENLLGDAGKDVVEPTGPPKDDGAVRQVIKSPGQNYLLVGADTRPGDAGRSDVMVLVHVPKDRKKVYLIHFPRDLYVDIPGRGKNKINASYAFGGMPLLVRTMQQFVGVQVDHVAKTDFTGFKDMTDAVGGVRVWAEEASGARGNGGVAIHKGWNDLNGEQALGFVRERYELSEGDISRGRRQMAFVKALMLKGMSPGVILNPVKFSGFVDAATKYLVTDESLDVADMRSEAFALRGLRPSDIVFVTAPFNGYGSVPGVGSIDVVDEVGMDRLTSALRNDTMDQYTDVAVTP